jgi:hypothetical protein
MLYDEDQRHDVEKTEQEWKAGMLDKKPQYMTLKLLYKSIPKDCRKEFGVTKDMVHRVVEQQDELQIWPSLIPFFESGASNALFEAHDRKRRQMLRSGVKKLSDVKRIISTLQARDNVIKESEREYVRGSELAVLGVENIDKALAMAKEQDDEAKRGGGNNALSLLKGTDSKRRTSKERARDAEVAKLRCMFTIGDGSVAENLTRAKAMDKDPKERRSLMLNKFKMAGKKIIQSNVVARQVAAARTGNAGAIQLVPKDIGEGMSDEARSKMSKAQSQEGRKNMRMMRAEMAFDDESPENNV